MIDKKCSIFEKYRYAIVDCGFCRYETTKYLWDSIFGLDINIRYGRGRGRLHESRELLIYLHSC